MIKHGYSRNKYDSYVYHRKLNDDSFVYLLLYADDMLIAAKDISKVDKLKVQLKQEFEVKDLGAAKKILEIKIHRNRQEGKLFLSQKKYIEKVLERIGMLDAKPEKLHLLLIFDFQ